MTFLKWTTQTLDRIGERTSAWAIYLIVALTLLLFYVVAARHIFGMPATFGKELLVYFFAYFIVFAVLQATLRDGHVRVLSFLPKRFRRWSDGIEAAGYLFLLLPFACALLIYALPIAYQSWSILEKSRESAGVHLVFLLKSAPVLLGALLVLQAIARAAASVERALTQPLNED